MFIINLI